MVLYLIGFLVLLIIALSLKVSLGQSSARDVWINQEEKMPEELAKSEIFMNETEIKNSFLHGKVDQVFKTANGKLVVVDTKRRKSYRVFKSDVIQVSVYGRILRDTQPITVAPYGYIRVVAKGKVKYIKIDLLSDKKLENLVKRHYKITTGVIKPTCHCNGIFH